MSALRLIADDLTGALDAGAQFTGALGPLPCSLAPVSAWPEQESLAVNLGCRDGTQADAISASRAALPLFHGADLAFKKIDSLLRGHWAAELAVAMASGAFATAILAPAFPAQQRVTRGGRQWARFPGRDWSMVEVDPVAVLAAHGLEGRSLADPADGGSAPPGSVLICDAETEIDLDRLCANLRSRAPVLWCGSAGLARALAGTPPRAASLGSAPYLTIVGTNNPVSLAQIAHLRAAAPERVVTFDHDAQASADRIAAALERTGSCLATADLPGDHERGHAAKLIANWLGDVFGRLPPPKNLIVSGGETLLALCRGLGVDHLVLSGEREPGLPISRLVGGTWDGVAVLSKSGAFGDVALFDRLLAT